MARRILIAAFAASAIALATPGSVAQEPSSSGFSASEQRRLAQGELVVRPESERRGHLILIGGTAFQAVQAPAESVWRAVLDTERYPRFVPQLARARVVSSSPGERLIFLRHRQGPIDASYFLHLQYHEELRIARFRLDRSRTHDIREGWGFFRIRSYGDRRSIVTFGVMADVGSGIISGLLRPHVHEWLLRIPEQLKNYVESSGRRRYAAP